MRNWSSILLVISLWTAAHAQKKDSLWTSAAIDTEITWQYLASDGTLVIANNQIRQAATRSTDAFTVVRGIDPQSGQIKWKYPLEEPASSKLITGIDFIPNTPFIKLNNVPLTVIDPYDGRILVDLAKENIEEEAHGYLLNSGHLWVSGTWSGDRCISVFDLRSGKKLWSNSEFLKEKSKAASKLNKLSALTGSALPNKEPMKLLCNPINNGTDKMILATSNGVFEVQMQTGQIIWEAELPDPNKGKMVKVEADQNFVKLIPGRHDMFYVVKAAYMTACSYANGKPVWTDAVKTSGPVDQIIYDEKGLILCPGSANVKGVFATGYIKKIDEKTGRELWADGIKFNGGIKTYLYTDKGLAVVMANSSSEKNSVNFIDVEKGKFVLDKSVTIDGEVQYLELVPKGLLYKTDRTINVLSLESGQPVLSLPVQTKNERPILSADGGDRYYFYSDDTRHIYEINKIEGTAKQLSKSKVEFQGSEAPVFLEVRQPGVCLYAEQNMTVIGPDGVARFNIYYPGIRTFHTAMQNVNNALDAIQPVMALAEAGNHISNAIPLTAGMTPAQQSAARNQYNKVNQVFASAGAASFILQLQHAGAIQTRLRASARSRDHVFMMTKLDDRTVIVGVHKDTGKVTSTIPLARRDHEPMYQVDPVANLLFYAPKGKNLLNWSNTANAVTCFAISE